MEHNTNSLELVGLTVEIVDGFTRTIGILEYQGDRDRLGISTESTEVFFRPENIQSMTVYGNMKTGRYAVIRL